MVTRDEVRAGGALLGDALGQAVRGARDLHGAIAGRVFGALPPSAGPVRVAHDAIAATSYGATRLAHVVIPRLGAAAVAARTRDDAPALSAAPAGRRALGAVNGLWGDRVLGSYGPLALPMTLFSEGGAVTATPEGVLASCPETTGSLAVFVHGLCESEESWALGAERRHGEPGVTYGSRLQRDLGITPLFLRYNSGRCVTDNARELAELLERVVAAWPVPVEELVLVGHSMGGLVIRGACHTGSESGHAWPLAVRHVFCLGSPHLGARLERGVEAAVDTLELLPEARAVARLLDSRSAGIKDLRYGACLHDDAPLLEEVPFLPQASYYVVAATLARDPEHPSTAWLGDLFVHLASAQGRGEDRHVPFPAENGAHFGGLHHFDLLNHPAVYDQLRSWIERGRVATSG
ncbi:MAG: hypothetical protein U0R80_00120 [Nocardioidaceae bacterium]